MIFVFAALFLIIFNYSTESSVSKQINEVDKYQTVSLEISEYLKDNISSLTNDNFRYNYLEEKFTSYDEILKAEILITDQNKKLKSIFSYTNTIQAITNEIPQVYIESIAEQMIFEFNKSSIKAQFAPIIYNANNVINLLPLKNNQKTEAVLVIVSNHDFIISNRGELSYAIFLLFLIATLFSLLTVYLIFNRFKWPLNKLNYGFKKTARGELYKLMEPEGDIELRMLTSAFNEMSKTLWENSTQLKKSNDELEESNYLLSESRSYFKTLIEQSPDSIVVTNYSGNITFYNDKAEKLFGYKKDEIVEQHIDKFFTQPVMSTINNADNKLKGVELLAKALDGELIPVYCVASSIEDEKSNGVAFLFIIRDISESRSFQEMMIRVDRYYTRGEMAGDIAHEINNYLAVLSGNLELMPLFMKKGQDEKIISKLELMRKTVDNIARFANGLMDPNQDEAVFEEADINQLLENVLAFLKPQNRFDGIKINTDLSTDLPLVEFDISQLQQLIINLVYNSAEAMQQAEGEKVINIQTLPTNKGDDTVRIVICDNGPGVQEDKKEMLFKKRFTTKRKGHGIGLVTCQKIIEVHSGNIGYEYDDGAKFFFDIPLKQKSKEKVT
ncbi:PAS domain S-box protein, partial [Candidatus Babeliales bacterium]|nr:PAS domain S-box protein [Candidatus Babeliales bacterium]